MVSRDGCRRRHRVAVLALWAWVAVGPAAAESVSGRLQSPPRAPWAGEVFDLALVWRLDRATFRYLEGDLQWDTEPLLSEPWGRPTLQQRVDPDGRPVSEITFRRRVMALAPGRPELPAAAQSFAMQVGVFRTSEYERAVVETVQARSEPASVEIRPLPAPPAGFSGAVGQFTLVATAEPLEVEVGQPVRWTLTLAGTGNWPGIRGLPPRALSDAFDVAGDAELGDAGPSAFERELTETLVVVPRRAGRHRLRSTEMLVFDPRAGAYVHIRSQPLELVVQPGIAPEPAAPAAAAPDYMRPADPRRALLDGTGAARSSWPSRSWRAALLLPAVAAIALWLLLAWLRALRSDPMRQARRAHARVGRDLAAFAAADSSEARRRWLREWQRDVAQRWQLASAAPVPTAFGEQEHWSRLWSESEVFLYGRERVLPEDWLGRARAAWIALGAPPPFRVATVFRPANLSPLVLALACALLVAVPGAPGQAQTAAASWAERVERDPLDWRARYNLAVTLDEESRTDAAAGQAAIAWAQQPGSAATRGLWPELRRKAGYALPEAAGLPGEGGAWAALAALAAPSTWQRLAAAAALLAGCAAALWLLAAFGHLPRTARTIGLGLLAPALGTLLAALAMVGYYGPLADREAVLVWRPAPLRPVPVATFPEEEPVHLAGGSVGIARQAWLGWWRVDLRDGRSGWLRQEDLLWVWRPAPPPVPGG